MSKPLKEALSQYFATHRLHCACTYSTHFWDTQRERQLHCKCQKRSSLNCCDFVFFQRYAQPGTARDIRVKNPSQERQVVPWPRHFKNRLLTNMLSSLGTIDACDAYKHVIKPLPRYAYSIMLQKLRRSGRFHIPKQAHLLKGMRKGSKAVGRAPRKRMRFLKPIN